MRNVRAFSRILRHTIILALAGGLLSACAVKLNDNSQLRSENAKLKTREVSIDVPLTGAFASIASEANFALGGSCSTEGEPVNVTIGGAVKAAPACANRKWSAVLDLTAVPEGAVEIVVIHANQQGGTPAEDRIQIVKDVTLPTVVIGAPVGTDFINFGNRAAFVVTGTCSENTRAVSLAATGGVTGTSLCAAGSFTGVLDLSSVADGPVTILADLQDEAGNSAVQASVTLTKDVGIPTVAIGVPVATDYINAGNRAAFTVSGTCSEETLGVTVAAGSVTASPACTGGAWSATLDLVGLDDGPVTITANHSDVAGNPATQASVTLVKDTVLPTVSFTAPLASSYINNANKAALAVSGGCSENTRTVSLTATGGVTGSATCSSGSWSATLDFSAVSDGAVTIQASHNDAAGNPVSASLALTKDVGIPTLAFVSTDPASPNPAANPKVIGTTSADTASIKLYLDASCATLKASGTKAAYEGAGIAIAVAENQSNAIHGTATDAAGNVSACTSLASYVHDSLNPAVSITTPASDGAYVKLSNRAAFTIAGACSEEGRSVTVAVGAVSATPTCTSGEFSASLNLTALDDGALTATASQTDTAGQSGSASRSLVKDTEAPTLAFASASPASPSEDNAPKIIGTTGADTSSVQLYIDSGCATSKGAGTRAAFVGTGVAVAIPFSQTSDVYGTATDVAGNTGSCTSLTSYVNNYVAPVVTVTIPASDGAYVNAASQSAFTISGACSKEGVNVTVQVGAVSGTAACSSGAYSVSLNLSGLAEGALSAVATQDDGKGTGSATRALDKNTVAPSLTTVTTNPVSPAASYTPFVIGTASADVSTVKLYLGGDCGLLHATGTKADFEGTGIQITAPGNITTGIRAIATDIAGNESACLSLTSYTNSGPMSGIYAVKPDGTGHYTGLAAAASAMMSLGIGGPVVIEAYAGVAAEAVGLNAVVGNSATNTITFRKASSAAAAVNVGSFSINGPDYVTIEGFDSLVSVAFLGASTNGVVQDTAVTAVAGAAISLAGAGNHNVTIRRVSINVSGGASGIMINGQSNNLTIERSEIVGDNASAGIYFFATGAASTGLAIRNTIVRGAFSNFGIGLAAEGANITGSAFHNTIRVSVDGSSGLKTSKEAFSGRTVTLDFRNNIIVHSGSTAGSYGILEGASGLSSNYNILYAPNGASIGFSTSTLASLAEWRSATGRDLNSLNADPLFLSETNSRIGDNSYAQNRGTSAVGVTTDFAGFVRSGTTPDAGAFENANAPSLPPALAGTYTVKQDGSGDYITPGEASMELEARGQSGPVILDFHAGTYSQALGIGMIPGNSAINTLTLRKAAGAGGPVSLNGGVACMGSDYVTIQGFDSLGGVSFGNGANYGSVLDTVVNGTVQFSGASTNGLIQNVVINPGVGGYGVFANGSGNHNLTVRAATINITGGVGIYLNAGQNNVTIERSEIIGSGANYGIYFYGATAASTGLVIRNNVIRGGFNNSGIILLAGMSSITGVGYHNTIRMDVEGSKGIILNRDVPFLTTFDFRNNIVSHTGTTTNSLAISFNTPTGNFTSNYNILHLPNGAAIGNWGANSATLPGWQLDTGKDAQSFSVDPLFLSATDSRIGDNSFAQNRGLNSLGVATDLIGAARDAATPDPGAYENAVAPTYPAPLGAASYSVKGDGSGDYTSVSKAVSDLQARGQSGPVVLEVYAGTYSQGIGLGSVSGNSATNTITIRKAAAAGGAVNVGPIFISGTDYVTVEGFDAITGPVIFANGATYGNLLSTSVNGGVQFTGGSTNGLVQDVSVTVSGGGVYGISLPSSGNHGFTARRVTVNASAAARGVYVTGQNNDLTIEGSQLIGNGAEYGLYFNSTASASTGLLVRNSIVRGTFTIGGVYFLGAAGAGITGAYNHNTVSVSTNGTYGVRFERVGGLTLEFKNNIVSHAGTTAASYALYNINANLTSNNNVYYVPSGASLAYTGGAMRSTLADWQLATGWDAQSLATNPLFVSATDLHIGDNSYAQNRGASGLGIATDLSGAARDASTPDPGAYENAVVPSFPPAMSGTYLVKPDGTGDYTTLWSALLDLEARGMSGAVVFEAYAGTYSKPLGLSAVAGNSAVNTITIGKSLSAGGAVNISSTVTVNGTDYVVFTGFDSISGTIQFGGGAVGGIVQDSTINVTGASASGILLSGTGNNGFVARGVVITAASSASGITISGQSDNVTIEESELIGSSGGNGIVFTAATAASSGLLIRNNFIRGTFVTAGINLNSASAAIAAAAYHNAIRISTNGSRGVLLTRASPLTIDFSNNIVAQYGTTTASYAIYDTGAALTSNNNILYAPSGGYIGYSGGANRPTFANWQALGFDASSINADPLFVSGTDLHIQAGSPAQGTGVAGLGVATDIDGQARANPPDIGADEN